MNVYLHSASLLLLIPSLYARVGVLDQNVDFFTNKWKIHVTGGRQRAEEIARREGLIVDHEIEGLPEIYILEHPRHPHSGNYANEQLTKKLESHDGVSWVEQSAAVTRRSRRTPVNINRLTCPREEGEIGTSNYGRIFKDPYFPAQWTMHDCRKNGADGPQYDINVMRVWIQYGYFGKGIVIIIIDDGLQTDHADLRTNYDPHFGLDLIDNDNTPDPVHTLSRIYSHGTRCAGQIGMQANNTVCGVGIAPLVTLGAVRLLGPKRSSDEADGAALLFRYQEACITSNSWGPTDDGMTAAHIGKLTEAALKTAVTEGCKGKGVIYVFAAGNGKVNGDNCACDPFVSSVYTIPVASADVNGKVTNYSERCSSIFVTAYSGDGSSMFNVATTDINDGCTISHTGTSASAPQVSAAIGIAKEANPNLTSRDIQHLFPYTCEVAPLQENHGTWVRGITGFYYSLDFGYGMLDIFKLVTLAKNFKPVPPLSMCVIKLTLKQNNEPVERLKGYKKEILTTACKGLPSEVNYLEHVQVLTTVRYPKRGDLQIVLKSAAGTSIRILENRPKDTNPYGIRNWAFDSVHAWGEPAAGLWEIRIFDQTGSFSNEGQVEQLTLVFHGSKLMPEHYKERRSYFEFKLPPEHGNQ